MALLATFCLIPLLSLGLTQFYCFCVLVGPYIQEMTHLPNLVSPKVVLRLSDRALILFLSFCKLSEVLKYIYM